MPSKWKEPTDRAGRERYRALKSEWKNARTSLRRKTEIEFDLDALCVTENRYPLENQESSPAVTSEKPLPANTESLDPFWKRMTSPDVQLQMHELDKSIAVDKAKGATDAERAAYLLKNLPDHPLNVMARAVVNNLRLEAKFAQSVPLETEIGWTVKHWLGPDSAKYNSNPLPPKTRADVLAAVADIYQILAVKDRDEPGWLVKAAEQRFAKPPQIWTLGENR
jgi:hypothetical protein